MNDPLLKLERLARAKRDDYLREGDAYRLGQEAQNHGVRYRLARGLIFLATRLSPTHRVQWQASRGAPPLKRSRER